ncbi:insulinase family protein, partial [Salidesulfovibrio brasiliensis]|uniref:insulinase family protein n=1 Tax=Salidesulfovibrio brasiliensis TaxID=221711 RepID=UPI0006CF997A
MNHGFEKIREERIEELGSVAQVWRHKKTAGRVLSMINNDENKVFGISFRTPPEDSTGIAHILEHSVLCGSRKYPVKEPFVELLKGSLQTFLNAMTFPDKTCYPVASANLADFYNLVDVYLDAAFFPLLDENRLKQEGWHYELDDPEGRMTYKGVVYNEMKGAYSSPDSLLYEYSQQSLFPDNTYGLDSGGDPFVIPDLTWEQFSEFHRTHYHPSNAYAFFYGDDDPEKRLEILDEYFNQFEPLSPEFSQVPLQPRFEKAREVRKTFPASAGNTKCMFTVNWLLAETADANLNLALHILEHILTGLPSSPLRKALMDSGLGEDLAGVGLEADIRQMFFSVGLKGVHSANAIKIESLIHDTLVGLVKNGIDPKDVEAAINSVEFDLRENNTGSYPRGLSLMFQTLSTWLYDDEKGNPGDPLLLLPFEEPLRNIKAWVAEGENIFEELISRLLLHNPHRTTVLLEPDENLGKELTKKERGRLAEAKAAMSDEDLKRVIEETAELRRLQEEPDDPEALASIPRLQVADLPEKNTPIPAETVETGGVQCHYHDLHTSGIAYFDLAFDLSGVPDELLHLVPLLGRTLVEAGTKKRDYVDLSQWIARTTGGISPQVLCQPVLGSPEAAARLIVRVKATGDKLDETADILKEILTEARLDDRTRLRQMVSESLARLEQALV